MLLNQSPTIILVVWTAPESPNGEILQYLIERRRQSVPGTVSVVAILQADEALQFRDESEEIEASTTYEYRIVAETQAGKGYGPWASITTRSASENGFALSM